MRVVLKPFQEDFVFSMARYPGFLGGWGTGKSLSGILKGMRLSEAYEKNLGLIARREFVDLRDSTIRDYEKYTGFRVNKQDKEYKADNGSVTMFRHLSELDSLKNINLGWFWIEQGEELDSEIPFFFLQGRLRRENVGFRTGFVTANANGHDWVWNLWKKQQSEDFPVFEATTFDNADVLPPDYIKSLDNIKRLTPSIYKRYVMNDTDEMAGGNWIIPEILIDEAREIDSPVINEKRILVFDPSLGGDEAVVYAMIGTLPVAERVFPIGMRDTMKMTGELVMMKRNHESQAIVSDVIGIGQGIYDRLVELGHETIPINSAQKSDNDRFLNLRAEMWGEAADRFADHRIGLKGEGFDYEILKKQLSGVQWEVVDSSGRMKVERKDKIRARLGSSPDHADCYIYGLWALKYLEDPDPDKVFYLPDRRVRANCGFGLMRQRPGRH